MTCLTILDCGSLLPPETHKQACALNKGAFDSAQADDELLLSVDQEFCTPDINK
jgi:hypothetical protein